MITLALCLCMYYNLLKSHVEGKDLEPKWCMEVS